MAGKLRFVYQNLVHSVGDPDFPSAALVASSAAVALPVTNLLDQLRSKVWQTANAWVVVDSVNDKIDFTEGGVARVATLTAGSYTTGALFAAHVAARLNASAVSNTYSCTYDSFSHIFTIQRATGVATIALPWLTGPNASRSAAKDLGFTANDSGVTIYNGDLGVYQSRHWVRVDIGTEQTATVAAIIGHNLSATGTCRIQSSDTSAFSVIFTNQVLAAGSVDDLRIAYFTSDFQRHWRLVIDDVQNSDGFAELGIWFVGPYTEPSIRPSINLQRERDELSAVSHAIDGANHHDTRPVRDVWSLEWLEAVEADMAIVEAVADAMPPGRDFFITFDADDPTNDTQYGYFAGNITASFVPYNYWTVVARFAEALG